ncbi:Ppx/GppA family phosphatase [Bacteroidetes/Chlorobi group bacterium ChocPot_Mid]|jgi:exopolyphosphatase/guanosine-5'-triphosphate,3'-diphosphate pyrophosphatase|nr:MAG: Ppx/GppA family phosphatase [Bacteroidetes/Chlorobi group bacterium ChocPot_Mid]
MEKTAPKIAAIDVGTNSFHLIIVSVDHRGILQVHYREKETVRLGCCAKDMKTLLPDAMERGVSALSRFALLANSEQAEISAVATSAVREAENKDDFLKKVKKATGIDIEVVSGAEEGRLIYLGAIHALPIENLKSLVIDIGGGSTETVIGYQGEIKYVHSEKIGAIRLTEGFFKNGIATKESVSACREFIKGAWSPTMKRLIETGFETVVGTSGTILNLAVMALSDKKEILPEEINGLNVSREDMLNIIEKVVNIQTPEERKLLPGIDESRIDIIVAGALIIEHAIKSLNIQNILISSYALREGIVYNTIQKNQARLEHHQLSHLRYETIQNICKRYNVLIPHSEHVKNISLRIFDDLQWIHGLSFVEREWLEAAALLHDVGFYISTDQHHKHSFYLISHCDMPGFTKDESEIIANVARYHRKSHPANKHGNFKKLPSDKKNIVKILAGILRIAEGIDRRQLMVIKDVKIQTIGKNITISLIPESNAGYPDIELWGADRRKSLLEEALGMTIKLDVKA